jgi:uncharacterized alkaline shock family protein YloU
MMHFNRHCNFRKQRCDQERCRKDVQIWSKDLAIEIRVYCMWNVKTKVMPVITQATGNISESIRKYLGNIPGKHDIK